MATNEDAWVRKNSLMLTLYVALAGLGAMLVGAAVVIASAADGREDLYTGVFVIPWLVAALLGIPGAYRRGVLDERKRQSLPDSGAETKR